MSVVSVLTYSLGFGVCVWLVVWIWRLLAGLRKFIYEVFIIWTMLRSAESSYAMEKNMRLHPYFCETEYLDSVTLEEIFHFFARDVNFGANSSFDSVCAVVRSYSHALLCRDRMNGSLRAFIGFRIMRSKTRTVIRVGLTLCQQNYTGGPYMYITFGYVLMRELLSHPLTPVYMVSKIYSLKPYVVGMKFKHFYPRYDVETPAQMKTILDDFARSVTRPTETYNSETHVISSKENYSHLKKHLTTISEKDLENPHIQYFVKNNPRWQQGDGMACIMFFDMKTCFDYCWMIVAKRFFSGLNRQKRNTSANHGNFNTSKRMTR